MITKDLSNADLLHQHRLLADFVEQSGDRLDVVQWFVVRGILTNLEREIKRRTDMPNCQTRLILQLDYRTSDDTTPLPAITLPDNLAELPEIDSTQYPPSSFVDFVNTLDIDDLDEES
ncbi:MAG TPA: hypothetical protein VHL11_16855 [Phototrophicaceae bacterium]|jgi:hypothetical protein|nr:hypothetical protein [Phototrophicaceae bacterium]